MRRQAGGQLRRAYATVTPRGRRSPAPAWRVKSSAGDVWRLSGLQRAALLWMTAQAGHGRHRYRVRDLAEAIACNPGTASKILRRLRSLSLIGARRPVRGRYGHVITWLPSTVASRRDRDARADRWPTRGNDSTLTPFGGYLSREGVSRSWRAARSGRPPGSSGPPGGWASGPGPRARGRPWPPRTVDEPCPSMGHRGQRSRLPLAWSQSVGPDTAAVWAGRCPRCRRVHAASLVLARPPERGPTRIGGGAPPGAPRLDPDQSPTRAAIARAVAPLLERDDQAEELLVRYLGYRRQTERPVLELRPPLDGPELGPLVADAIAAARADLARLGDSRLLVPPEREP